MGNDDLRAARREKNDEFYTQFHDIQKEIGTYLDYSPKVFMGKTVLLPCDDPEWSSFTKYFAQNFQTLGLKKLISTSYAPGSKPSELNQQPTLFETESPQFDAEKTIKNGKIFVLDSDRNGDQAIDVNDLTWSYLEGDGDFRSPEITALKDQADIIITNPPFSLFREFLSWLIEGEKTFAIIGNMNQLASKDVFPLIRDNKVWLGQSINSGDREFRVPDSYPLESAGWRIDELGQKYIRVKGVRWFTNIEHGRRHQELPLMSEDDNIKFSKHKEVKGIGYRKYVNFDAIEIPYTDAIPKDYDGLMGVPISFLDK